MSARLRHDDAAGETIADATGPFAPALARWVARHSGSEAVAALARLVAASEAAGHGCARLDDEGRAPDFPTLPAVDLAAARRHDWVGDGAVPTPLVLDHAGRGFSWRSWSAERDIARALLQRASHATALDPDALAVDIEALFAGQDRAATADQRRALAQALSARCFVLGGGPGTGKTTTVQRLLLLALRHHRALGFAAPPRIALAAPTGKAAARLAESLRNGRAALEQSLGPDWRGALDALPDAAVTLHRLLGFEPWRDGFRHGPERPLPARLVVVDEASMIDLSLMRALLAALAPEALLVLVGDPEQLASVAAGSVLADLMAAADPDASQPPSPLAGRTCRLGHVFRARGALVGFAEALRRGEAEPAFAALSGPGRGETALRLLPAATPDALRRRLRGWLEAEPQLERFDTLSAQGIDPSEALDRLRELQLLAALREGPFGVAGLNAAIGAWQRRRLGVPMDARWYPGRAVMVTRNDPALGLYNGDVGIALLRDGELAVWFDARDDDGRRQPRPLAPRLLPAHDDAAALTIHKSQGSEFERVVLVLPPDPDSPILSRQLLYTGVTRARNAVELWAQPQTLAAAIARPIERHGGLRERLRHGS